MRNYGDMIGKKFGRLTVTSQAESRKGRRYWNCLCECGNTKIVDTKHLNDGNTRSCGCLQKEVARKNQTKHGMKYTPIYRAWNSMKNRCRRNEKYKDVEICEEWLNSFEKFYEDMGETYFSHSFLDRIDNLKGYNKENCRWVDVNLSNLNKTNVTKVIVGDDIVSLHEYCLTKNISYSMTRRKINKLGLKGKVLKPEDICG